MRDYSEHLKPILASCTENVSRQLAKFWSAATEAGDTVTGVRIDVYVDQDGEGPFDVWARFEGDAAFTLDRQFDAERHLFGVEWGEDGWEPNVPRRPRGWTRDDLERAVLEGITEWISPMVPPGSREGFWQIGTPYGEAG